VEDRRVFTREIDTSMMWAPSTRRDESARGGSRGPCPTGGTGMRAPPSGRGERDRIKRRGRIAERGPMSVLRCARCGAVALALIPVVTSGQAVSDEARDAPFEVAAGGPRRHARDVVRGPRRAARGGRVAEYSSGREKRVSLAARTNGSTTARASYQTCSTACPSRSRSSGADSAASRRQDHLAGRGDQLDRGCSVPAQHRAP
jgi:hypothetical protein